MKQTRKIFVAILVLMTILMSLAVVAIPASAASETVSMNVYGTNGTKNGESISWTNNGYTFRNDKDKSSTSIRNSDTNHYRIYAKSKVTIEGEGITKIVITATSNSYATALNPQSLTSGVSCTVSGSTVTLTVSSGTLDSISFTANAQCRINKVAITYDKSGCTHATTVTETVAPTCTEAGKTVVKCANIECGEVISSTDTEPALGHTPSDEGVVTPPSCVAGYTTHVCSVCEEEYTVAGDPAVRDHKDTGLDAKCDECGKYFVPASPFKLEIYQANKKATYYFTGSMSGYYLATSTDITKGVDIYTEEATGGYYLYFLNGTTKNYLYIQINGTYTNIKYGSTKAVWEFDTNFGMFKNTVNGNSYYLGTYSNYVTISASATSFIDSSNVDKSQFPARPVSLVDHVCDYTTVVTPPTFDSEGYTTYSCGVCGQSHKDDFVPALVAVATADGDKFETLAEALENGSEIVLLQNIELDAPIVITNSYVLDLNGYTLSYESTVQGETMITNKSSLVIKDSSEAGTGVINYNYVGAADSSYGKGNYTISNGGTLTVEGGKITIADLRGHAKYPIDNNSTSGDAILVINGGHLYNYNTSAIRQFCNSTTNKNSVTINGGIIEGYCAIWVQNPGSKTVNGSLAITGGEIKSTAKAYVEGTSELKDVSSRIYFTIDGNGGAWSEDSSISITGGTFNENVNLADNAPVSMTVAATATFNGYIELPEARYNGNNYATLAEALEAAKGETNIVIELLADATLDITAWQTLAIGGDTTETITINGNGKTLTFNKKNSDWNNIATNNDATLILNNMTITDSGYNNGPWNRYDLNFACDVELNNVTAKKALAFKSDAILNNVTINESGDNYAIWIQPNGQTVEIDGLTVNSAGRGIKIDEQYIDAPAKVALSVENAIFTTAKKAAILVKSVAGAEITLTNVNIDGVAADNKNAVWNDSDAAVNYGKIEVDGGTLAQEDVEDFVATVTENGKIAGYYATLADAFAAGGEVTLLKDVALDSSVSVAAGASVVLNLNGYSITGTDNATGSFGLININPGAELTVNGEGKITLTSTNNRGWKAYSSVISNQRGKLTVNGGIIEHLGGTDMAYGIDNLTNGKGTYAETVINGGTVKSTYRAIRQFLNGVEAQNILTINGGAIEGANKSVWMQDPSKNANTGTLTVGANAQLIGDVYLFVTAGSTEWPVEVSIAAGAVQGEIITGNVPAGYELANIDGNYGVYAGSAKIGNTYYETISAAIEAAQDGDVITLLAGTFSEAVTHSTTKRFGNKNITIEGAANYGTVLTGGIYIGYDDNNPYTGSVTVKGVVFEGKGLSLVQLDAVSVVDCKFNNVSGNAIHIIADSITETVTVTGNVIDGATMGIMVRNGLTVVIDGNDISNTDHNSINLQQAHNANTYPITITNNTLSNWGLSAEGRAIRIALGEIANTRTGTAPATKVVNISGNTLVNENAPEEFVKITSVDSSMNVSLTSNILIGSTPDGVEYILLEGNGADSVDTDNNPVVTENQPHILDGYWWIGSTNTGIKAEGIDGEDGKDGADGEDGLTPTFKVENGIIYVSYDNGATWTDLANIKGEDGKDGVDGEDGKDGVDGEDGKDGVDGEDGKDGVDGEDGKDGVDGAPGKDGEDGKDGVDGKDGKDGNDNNQVVITSIAVATVAIIFALGVLLFWRVKRRSWWCIH